MCSNNNDFYLGNQFGRIADGCLSQRRHFHRQCPSEAGRAYQHISSRDSLQDSLLWFTSHLFELTPVSRNNQKLIFNANSNSRGSCAVCLTTNPVRKCPEGVCSGPAAAQTGAVALGSLPSYLSLE